MLIFFISEFLNWCLKVTVKTFFWSKLLLRLKAPVNRTKNKVKLRFQKGMHNFDQKKKGMHNME